MLDERDRLAAGVEDVDRIRIGGLRLGEVRAEILGLAERGEVAADHLAACGGEGFGEGFDHLPAGRIVRSQSVDLLDPLLGHPGTHRPVDLTVRKRDPDDVFRAILAGRVVVARIGDDQGHARAVDEVAHGSQNARRDDADDHVHLVLQHQLARLRDADRRFDLGVLAHDREIAGHAGFFERDHEAVIDLVTERGIDAALRQEQPDLGLGLGINWAAGGRKRRDSAGGKRRANRVFHRIPPCFESLTGTPAPF